LFKQRIVIVGAGTVKEKVVVGWSGGKDSAFTLYKIQQDQNYEVQALLTTMTQDYDRISIHGVRRVLLEQQANALGLPLQKMFIKKGTSNTEYEAELSKTLKQHVQRGVTAMVFGDIFLEDVRHYREGLLSKAGLQGIFPLWKRDTRELAEAFVYRGFKTIITVVDSNVLDKEFVGREYDQKFLADLPKSVDPCGENGEFHTFVYDGPNFKKPVQFTKGEVLLRENRFWYCDLVPS
jgi:uncharacterized protein (TIGR00290 family)